jgi:hypothetical protein|tara:strand:+ start:552 stop:716 length:165 start_codon:yes stop_codon:yes gene_type:complete
MGKVWKRSRIRNKIAANRDRANVEAEVIEEQAIPEVSEPRNKTIRRTRKPKGKE